MSFHRSALLFSFAAACFAAGSNVPEAAGRMQEAAAKLPEPMSSEFRRLAAEALAAKYSDLSKSFETAPLREAPRRKPGQLPAEVEEIRKRMSQMRALPTDSDRAQLAMALADDIDRLPGGAPKLSTALSLANLSTEGDLGRQALQAVAASLGQALKESAGSTQGYLELAQLIRYEHVEAPIADTSLDAATALLELRDAVLQEAGFSLAGLDGKTYSLAGLRGKVVLVNFWATWCPPCRKEMPDLEKLYESLGPQGFVVLAISDEDRPTVEKFLQGKGYTFPILLDPGREIHKEFQVEGIPRSIVYDREGKLAAQSIDMRTASQFRAMLKQAGLESH